MRLVDFTATERKVARGATLKADARIDKLGLRERLGNARGQETNWRLTGRVWAVGNRPTGGFLPNVGRK